MNTKILAALALAIVAIAAVAALMFAGNGPNTEEYIPGEPALLGDFEYNPCTEVYLENGTVQKFSSTKGNIREALEDAVTGIEFSSASTVKSVGGIEGDDTHAWTVFKYSSTNGWQQLSRALYTDKTTSGTRLAVVYSEVSVSGGVTSYSKPTAVPEDFEVYFFVQFKEDYSANPGIKKVLTEDQRRDGFWVAGHGRTAAEALQDAADRYEWDLSMASTGYVGWLNSFFGLSDEYRSDNSYTFWSQFQWTGSGWTFNQAALGGVDLSDGVCISLVRQTTSHEGSDAGPSVTPDSLVRG